MKKIVLLFLLVIAICVPCFSAPNLTITEFPMDVRQGMKKLELIFVNKGSPKCSYSMNPKEIKFTINKKESLYPGNDTIDVAVLINETRYIFDSVKFENGVAVISWNSLSRTEDTKIASGNSQRQLNDVAASDPNSESDFTFVRSSDGKTVTITGYVGTKQIVNIPSVIRELPVTLIADRAFYRKNLTKVTIPESIVRIGELAFSGNELTSIIIPNSVTTVGNAAFNGNQLARVTLPDSVTVIGASAFSVNKLTNVTIPNSVIRIGESAFAENQLTSVTIPNNLKELEHKVFESNKLTNVIIPNSVTSIGNSVFNNNQLTNVTISTNVTSIGIFAFYQNKLTSIIIPPSVNKIESSAFSGPGLGGPYNELTKITIGNDVMIGGSAFPGDFNDVYRKANRRAGTYVNRNGSWSEDW